MYNILIGGAAGDGIETAAALLEKTLKRSGLHVFAIRDFMSRVRGGHNFVQIRFGNQPIAAHRDALDGVIAFNEESYHLHEGRLKEDGFVLCDTSIPVSHSNLLHAPLKEKAKEAGNARTVGSVITGMLIKIFSLNLDVAKEVFSEEFSDKLLDANLKALQSGYDLAEPRYQTDTTDLSQEVLMTGAEAMSLGALAGDMRFYSAYPMSPSTTLLAYFQQHSKQFGVVAEQAEDEISAINLAIGAAFGGVRAMTGTSGGGFALMVEALGLAGIAEIPLVIVDVQRPGPATDLPTRTEQSDLKFVISASQGEFPRMVISIQDHQHSYLQTKRAMELAEKYQMPVIILSDQHIADSAVTLPLTAFDGTPDFEVTPFPAPAKIEADEYNVYKRYQYTENGVSPRLSPGETEYLVRSDSDEHTEYGVLTESGEVRVKMMDKRMRKMETLRDDLMEPIFIGEENPDILVVGFGSTYAALVEALGLLNKENGPRYAALSFGDVYPLPTKLLTKYAEKAKKVISVEQNATGQLASLIRETTLIPCEKGIWKYDGRQLSVDDIVTGLHNLEKEGNR